HQLRRFRPSLPALCPRRSLVGDPQRADNVVKEANTAVSTQKTSQGKPRAGFGPKGWIVDDMSQRCLAAPPSVDPAWHDFFADYKPAMASGSIVTPDEATAANATASAKRAGTDAPAAATVAPVKPTVPASTP